MDGVWICVGAALELGFAFLFYSTYLDARGDLNERCRFLILGWLGMAAYGFWKTEGLYGELMDLLVNVLMMLCLFGEAGVVGLGLTMFGFLIPVGLEGVIRTFLDAEFPVAVGKLALLGVIPVLRRFRAKAVQKHNSPQELESMLLRQHMEMQQESMAALEQNYRLQRKSTHEFEHHTQVLADLLEQDQVPAAKEYLGRLKKNRSIHLMSVSSNHPVVDAILNQKYRTAVDNNIKMQIRVNDLSGVSIPTDSLVVVLTNLLDNAIEACRRVEGYREILCNVIYEDGLFLSIRNTSQPVEIVDGKIPTSKADSLSHGFGLLSVTYVLDKLGAEYTFGYEEGWFRFAAEIDQI